MTLVTRFAPSPTGFLHIGSARTALFNWLYARKMGAVFHLRIEDTDRERSTTEAIDAIINGLKWLELDWDGEVVLQSTRQARHKEVAEQMVDLGKAYYCFMSAEEIRAHKETHPHKKILSPWRDKSCNNVQKKSNCVIRLRVDADLAEETVIDDIVQGRVAVPNSDLDDMVLLRSDGTPTYMLAVVVDDHDIGVTHVIRGVDHLTNAFRQQQIYFALGWRTPEYAHIPLIHGADGTKLSKRHGALGLDYYKNAGYLPEAMRNYLLRLGWGHADKEIIPTKEAIQLFDIKDVGQSPAKFDINKLNSLNAHYINASEDESLLHMLMPMLADTMERVDNQVVAGKNKMTVLQHRVLHGMKHIKNRAKTLLELCDLATLYLQKKATIDHKSKEILTKPETMGVLQDLQKNIAILEESDWNIAKLKSIGMAVASENAIDHADVMKILRASLIGTFESPGIYEVLEVLGKEETITRLIATTSTLPLL